MPGRRRKDAQTGPERISRLLKTMPDGPGVYRMIDSKGDVLYVGKARDVKKRVTSYARPTGHNNRIARMIMATADIEVVTCQTETDALLLEANLIKRLRPRYNVLLRDDKSFPYILLARDHPAPQILKHRGARKRGGDYFGPFASAGAVNRTINTLQRAFLLRSCSDSVYESRTRPCLLYQIKRCSAPCTGEISLKAYDDLVHQANRFLRGQSGPVRDQLNAAMQAASDQLEFERAAEYRNRLWALAHVQQHQGINPQTIEEADVFAAYQDAGQTCIQVFFFRTGQNWGNRAYFPRADKSLCTAEVLDAFLAQFYDDKPCPRLVLLSEDVSGRTLLADALSLKTGHKVRVAVPRRGEKRELVLHALANAREALARRLAESANERHLLASLADTFALEEAPHRIEVYDNSHIQGSAAVGAMIVAGPDGFEKGQYRKFNIKSEAIAPGDDIAMMREVLTRRFRRLVSDRADAEGEAIKPDKGASAEAPDMVLIDGGEGQLNVALSVLADLGISDVPVAAIAKGPDRDAGRERFFLPGREPFMLEPRNPVLYYVQRLRDEAHRFAIGSHRARRKQSLGASPLDDIDGIGPTRKRALLQHFGSAKAVSRAGLADLKVVDGISANMAQTIYDFFHDRHR